MPHTTTFALMLTRLDGWYQSQVWEGATAAAESRGIRILGLVGSALGDFHGDGGSSEVYRIASAGGIDGYLPVVGSLANANGLQPVEALFSELPPRPTVCIGVPLKGYAAVVPSQGGIDQVVEHLVYQHGLRRIAFLSGPLVNPDAQHRLDLFRRTMEKCGLEFSLDWMEQGGFTKDKGHAATERLLQRIGIPQAIVCANDAMAFGAQEALRRRGVEVPGRTILTGFDDIEESRTQEPPLTTVSAHPFEVAFRAVEALEKLLLTGRCPKRETVPSALVLRASCGCLEGGSVVGHDSRDDVMALPTAQSLVERLETEGGGWMERLLQPMELRQLSLWDGLLRRTGEIALAGNRPQAQLRLLEGALLISRLRERFLMRRQLELHQVVRDQYTLTQSLMSNLEPEGFAQRLAHGIQIWNPNRMRIQLFRADLSPVVQPVFSPESFRILVDSETGVEELDGPEATLVPENEEQGVPWTVLSLSLREEHYGILQVRGWTRNQLFLESLRLMLVNILSSAYRFRLERGMHEELRKLSQRDELTGILNRRGFLGHGGILVQKAIREGKQLGVVLCDLDGLKSINDSHGHFEGDLAIRALASALEDVFRAGDVVARLGGDEFAVLALLEKGADLHNAVARLHGALEHRSGQLRRPWTARTSAGWIPWDPSDGTDLESVLVRADAFLYRDKKRRRTLA